MTNLTIPELLSGSHDEELRVLVAEARGYCRAPKVKVGDYEYQSDEWLRKETPYAYLFPDLPKYETSLDATRELLADLTKSEKERFAEIIASSFQSFPDEDDYIGWIEAPADDIFDLFLTTSARQICVAYLIVKGVLK